MSSTGEVLSSRFCSMEYRAIVRFTLAAVCSSKLDTSCHMATIDKIMNYCRTRTLCMTTLACMMGVRNASSGHSMPPSGGSQKRIKNRNEYSYGYDRIKLECARPPPWISTLGG